MSTHRQPTRRRNHGNRRTYCSGGTTSKDGPLDIYGVHCIIGKEGSGTLTVCHGELKTLLLNSIMSTPPGSSPFVPSSPRLDAIQTVNQRVEHLVRTAQAQLMLNQVSLGSDSPATHCRCSYLFLAPFPFSQVQLCRQQCPSPAKKDEIHKLFQSDSDVQTTSRTALSGSTSWRDYKTRRRGAGTRSFHKINTYLRRRDAFGLLDADMIVRGKVCDKSPVDLTISLVEVVSDTTPTARSSAPPIEYDRYILASKGSATTSHGDPKDYRRLGSSGGADHDEMDEAFYR